MIYTDTFWYFTTSYKKTTSIFHLFQKNSKIFNVANVNVLALSRFQKIIFVILFNKQP